MGKGSGNRWLRTKKGIRSRLLSGILVLVPFVVTVLVVRWFFLLVTVLVRPIISRIIDHLIAVLGYQALPRFYVGAMALALSILVLVVVIYIMGAIAQFVIGRRLIRIGEEIVIKIPLVGAVYAATKQLVTALSFPQKAAVKSVVLVEFPRPGFRAIGFLTGRIQDSSGKVYCKVFIPTAPNPTTGFFQIVPIKDVRQADMEIDDAFKMILSGGLIGPESLGDRPIS